MFWRYAKCISTWPLLCKGQIKYKVKEEYSEYFWWAYTDLLLSDRVSVEIGLIFLQNLFPFLHIHIQSGNNKKSSEILQLFLK